MADRSFEHQLEHDVNAIPDSDMAAKAASEGSGASLKRTVSLPLLVFYGLGVTVGAGIFALIGEIVGVAGPRAPLAFCVAGIIAGFTGLSYSRLTQRFPVAGGEAVYVNRGIGAIAGRVAGLGVLATGTISSAAIALAFGGYLSEVTGIGQQGAAVALIFSLAIIACWGIQESIVAAAVVTLIEVGTLFTVAALGASNIGVETIRANVTDSGHGLTAVLAAAGIAFFAFIGFEDIVNMAEETKNPQRVAPQAIVITLVLTIVLYLVLSMVAVAAPDPDAIADSTAPMAELFEQLTGRSPDIISTIAVVAMVNGVLVQIMMASRMLYGMASDRQISNWFAQVHAGRQTPVRATIVVASIIGVLCFFPLLGLAKATSIAILGVFALVNTSAMRLLGRSAGWWWWNALLGATSSAGLCAWQLVDVLR